MPQRFRGALRHASGADYSGQQGYIRPCAKTLSRAGQYDDAHPFIAIRSRHGAANFSPHLPRPGVQFIRTVQSNRGDPLRNGVENFLVAHPAARRSIVFSQTTGRFCRCQSSMKAW